MVSANCPPPVGVPGKSSLRLRQTGGASDTGECRDIHTHTHSDQLLERAGVGRSTEPPTVQEQHPLPEAADPVPGDPAVDAHRPPPQTGARWLRPNVRVHTFHHTTIARTRPGPPVLHLVTKVPFSTGCARGGAFTLPCKRPRRSSSLSARLSPPRPRISAPLPGPPPRCDGGMGWSTADRRTRRRVHRSGPTRCHPTRAAVQRCAQRPPQGRGRL